MMATYSRGEVLRVYLVSGQIIDIDEVTEWKVEKEPGGKFKSIYWTQGEKAKERLKAIDLDQISAISIIR